MKNRKVILVVEPAARSNFSADRQAKIEWSGSTGHPAGRLVLPHSLCASSSLHPDFVQE